MTLAKNTGSITLAVMVVILAISIIAVGAASIVNMSIGQVKKIESWDTRIDRLRDAAETVANTIAADPTPEAQSVIDPIHQTVSDLSGELQLEIVLEDLSGKLGVNWVRTPSVVS